MVEPSIQHRVSSSQSEPVPKRSIAVSMYLLAFVISVAIFAIGVYVGKFIDSAQFAGISGEVDAVSARVSASQLLLLTEGNASFCPLYISELGSIESDMESLGYKLTFLEEVRHVRDDNLKRRYFILEGESYFLARKVQILCNDRSVLLINFYSNKENACPECRTQGDEVLRARDSLASKNISVKLFSFDGDLGSPVAESFKTQYNVTGYPTLVINGQNYPGFRDSAAIERLVVQSRS